MGMVEDSEDFATRQLLSKDDTFCGMSLPKSLLRKFLPHPELANW